jgi:hypothetical protein
MQIEGEMASSRVVADSALTRTDMVKLIEKSRKKSKMVVLVTETKWV